LRRYGAVDLNPIQRDIVSNPQRRFRTACAAAVTGALLASALGTPAHAAPSTVATNAKRNCLYSRHSIATLDQLGQQVGRAFDCAVVFNDASPDWKGWEHPWFIGYYKPDSDWGKWMVAAPGRQLIITQSMIPSGAPADWRQRGANGEYDAYARELAQYLVAKGLGGAIIRLGHEANGNWYKDSIGTWRADFNAWRDYWGRIVRAMRAVAGAQFTFDWCINAGVRAIPFALWYPGNSVVDVIGADVYDTLPANKVTTSAARFGSIANQAGGLTSIVAFAKKNGKPISIPEWGLIPADKLGAGDDPAFVAGIASVVHNNEVAYHSYFDAATGSTLRLSEAPASLQQYRTDFVR
jgi:Glycosyl hydrolase family 26